MTERSRLQDRHRRLGEGPAGRASPGVLQDPVEGPRHLRRARLPDAEPNAKGDRADRCRPLPFATAVADPRSRVPDQPQLQHGPEGSARPPDRGQAQRPDGDPARAWRDLPGPALPDRPAVQAASRFLPHRASPIGRRWSAAAASGPGPRWSSSTRPKAAARPSSRKPGSRSRRAPAICSPGTISTRMGEPNPVSMHSGCPVTAGVKYVITKWYRERPWIYTDTRTY